MSFDSYPFLNLEQREKCLKTIFELKDEWTTRGVGALADFPFYSLGAAVYLDKSMYKDKQTYEKRFPLKNSILKDNFSWLYEHTKNFLEEKFNEKFDYYDSHAALPGFHIFLNDDFFEIPIASVHTDTQFQYIDWQGKNYDDTKTISFTAYLKIPQNGAGINVWQANYQDFKDLGTEALAEKLKNQETKYLKFKEGEIAIHTGLEFHQIAPFEDIQEGDERISFQGHAIWVEDRYLLHW